MLPREFGKGCLKSIALLSTVLETLNCSMHLFYSVVFKMLVTTQHVKARVKMNHST